MRRHVIKAVIVGTMLCLSYSSIYGETAANYDEKPISLYVNGTELENLKVQPVQFNGYTLVPAREVFEQIGAMVLWKPSERKVYVDGGNSLLVLEVDEQIGWLDGEEVQMAMPAKIIDGKVMIPTRFVAEQLGYEVIWHGELRSVQINTKKDEAPEMPQVPQVPEELEKPEENIEEIPVAPIVPFLEEQPAITYIASDEALMLIGIEDLTLDQISIDEQYHDKKVVINLNKDCSSQILAGAWTKAVGEMASVEIVHLASGTQIILKTNTIQAVNAYESEGNIMLQCVKPSQKYDQIVVIDAGHGDQDPGASYGQLQEKQMALEHALALQRALQQSPDIKVYLTREDDTFLKLKERADMANQIDPDLFISLHVNSAENKSAGGIETYYTEKADTRNKVLATIIQEALVSNFGTRDRGVKANTFVVTKYTEAPAVLVEIGFISHEGDRAMLTSEGFADRYAQVLYDSILQYNALGLND